MRSSKSQPLPAPLNIQAGELSQWTDVLASHLGYLRSIAELYNLPLAPPSIILEVALEHHCVWVLKPNKDNSTNPKSTMPRLETGLLCSDTVACNLFCACGLFGGDQKSGLCSGQ